MERNQLGMCMPTWYTLCVYCPEPPGPSVYGRFSRISTPLPSPNVSLRLFFCGDKSTSDVWVQSTLQRGRGSGDWPRVLNGGWGFGQPGWLLLCHFRTPHPTPPAPRAPALMQETEGATVPSPSPALHVQTPPFGLLSVPGLKVFPRSGTR